MAAFKNGNPGCCCGSTPVPVPCSPCPIPKTDLLLQQWTFNGSTFTMSTGRASSFVLTYVPDGLAPGVDGWISDCFVFVVGDPSQKVRFGCVGNVPGWIRTPHGKLNAFSGTWVGRDDCSECGWIDSAIHGPLGIVSQTALGNPGWSCPGAYQTLTYTPTWTNPSIDNPPGHDTGCSPFNLNWRRFMSGTSYEYWNVSGL